MNLRGIFTSCLKTKSFEYLGDGGVFQNWLDVLSAEISAAGHQHCGNNQHSKSPPTGPVDYMMTCWEETLQADQQGQIDYL